MPTYEYVHADPLLLTLCWQDGKLDSINLQWADDKEHPEPETLFGGKLANALKSYLKGKSADWPEPPVELDEMTPFRRSVLKELAKIPSGQTLTYGQLAERAGNPNAARAVGRVMATNPWPLIYPCHRVVGSGGLTGFGPGLDMKEYLLRLEGVVV